MKLVVCSEGDKAGQNIKDVLLSFSTFEERRAGEFKLYISDEFYIAETKERLICADYIDQKLAKYVDFEEILFASRHSSKDGRKIFTVHVSGNVGTADFGGRPYSLAKPSPHTMKNYVLALKDRMDRKPEFEFTMEVTHHGPSEISKPSAFYEIGSTEEEWKDREAAEIVAESIVEAIKSEKRDWNVAVGVGGTHYAPRQTEIILSTTFTFGHNFAKYTFEHLNTQFLVKAVKLSEAEYIIIDEKSVNSAVKGMVNEAAEIAGVEVLKSKKVKREFKLLP
ncbi:D-aminoacyl-tRNA deacylase [Archaeoglobus sp.]